LKGRAFRDAAEVFVFVITSGRTGVPNERRFFRLLG
jgi:hypothetical protein